MKIITLWHDFCDIMTKLTVVSFPLHPQIGLLGNITIVSAHLRSFQKKF